MNVKLVAQTAESEEKDFPLEDEFQTNLFRKIAGSIRAKRLLAPWTAYYAIEDGRIVASCGFKDLPKDGHTEIAYQVFPEFRERGLGTRLCAMLVEIAAAHDPDMRLLAETKSSNAASNRILEKNGFKLVSRYQDETDREILRWERKAFEKSADE